MKNNRLVFYPFTVNPKRKLPAEKVGERVAVDVLHDVVPVAVAVVEVVGLDDARMVDLLHEPFLGAELAHLRAVRGELLVEDLHRDEALVHDIPGLPDRGHAAVADLLDELQVRDLENPAADRQLGRRQVVVVGVGHGEGLGV